jgi:4-diphosphocytidyl-2-C-methyl-D-erythritol kinase
MTTPDRVRVSAHAKVNLFLRILSRESNGYHGLETAFSLVELADEITVTRTQSGVTLTVSGAGTGPMEKNLAFRAASALLDATGNRFGVNIELTKNIPTQAGLGGGSTDAAATLHAVNTLADHIVPKHEILQIASKLGADVPFFASGAPFALGWNRGERLLRVTPPPTAPALIVKPATSVSTPDAFGWYDAATPDISSRGSIILEDDSFATWGNVGRLGGNDFETVVFHRQPELRETFEKMAATGPLLVRMSGSGSAIFAIYRNESGVMDAESILAGQSRLLIKSATRARPAPAPTAE